MSKHPLTLVIVDGHVRARTALTERLQRLADVVVLGAVGELAQAVEMIGRVGPHAVLVDPRTLGISPLAALAALVGSGPPIVVYTASLAGSEEEGFAQAGASATLLKGSDVPGLLHQLRAVIVAHGHTTHIHGVPDEQMPPSTV